MDKMTMRDVKGILLHGSSGIDRCFAFIICCKTLTFVLIYR